MKYQGEVVLPPFGCLGFRGFNGTVRLELAKSNPHVKRTGLGSIDINLEEGRPLRSRFLGVQFSINGFAISSKPATAHVTNAVVFHAGLPPHLHSAAVALTVAIDSKSGKGLISKGQMQDVLGAIEAKDATGATIARFTVLPYARQIPQRGSNKFPALQAELHEYSLPSNTTIAAEVHVADPVMFVGAIDQVKWIFGITFRKTP